MNKISSLDQVLSTDKRHLTHKGKKNSESQGTILSKLWDFANQRAKSSPYPQRVAIIYFKSVVTKNNHHLRQFGLVKIFLLFSLFF